MEETCDKCGKALPATTPRFPCPVCGTRARLLQGRITEVVAPFAHALGTQRNQAGQLVGVSESPRMNGASSSGTASAGLIGMVCHGPAPNGETGALDACDKVVRFLRKDGGDWATPTADGLIENADGCSMGSLGVLQFQVTRPGPPWFFENLNHEPQELTVPVDVAAEWVWEAIDRKRRKRYRNVEELTLLVDADQVPIAFDDVADRFLELFAQRARATRFAGIFLVGSSPEFVFSLSAEGG